MGIRLNLFSNGQIVPTEKYKKTMEKIKWGPGHIPRDEFGIPLKKDSDQGEEVHHADISK